MSCRVCIIAIVFTLPTVATAQNGVATSPVRPNLKTGKVPSLLYAQIPSLKPGSGVVVLEAPAKSPARAIGFQRYDIVISCDGALVKDNRQLARLFTSGTRKESIPVVVLRRGKLHTLYVSPRKPIHPIEDSSKSIMKPGGPPPLRVTAEPMSKGRFKINFEYYVGSGKMIRVERTGTLAEIHQQVKLMNAKNQMPANIYDLASAVIEHIRQSTTSKQSTR